MRVTWLCLEWPVSGRHSGGVGRYVRRLAEAVAPMVDLTVVAPAGAVSAPGVHVVRLPPAAGRVQRYYVQPWLSRRAVQGTEPDIVHAHGDDWLLARDVPVVRTFYGRSISEARSSRGLRKLNHLVLAATEVWSARRATLRLAIASESSEAFKCHEVIPPLAAFTAPPPRQPTAEPSFAFIGTFAGRKRGWLAAQLIEAWRAEAGTDARLVAIGPEADRTQWPPWVEHRASPSDDEVRDVISRSWALIAPSAYEGFGIPAIEALHQRCRVITSPSPGSVYLSNLGGPDLPMVVRPDTELQAAIAEVVASGPCLTEDEERDAARLVSDLVQAADPRRLVERYQAVLTAGASR